MYIHIYSTYIARFYPLYATLTTALLDIRARNKNYIQLRATSNARVRLHKLCLAPKLMGTRRVFPSIPAPTGYGSFLLSKKGTLRIRLYESPHMGISTRRNFDSSERSTRYHSIYPYCIFIWTFVARRDIFVKKNKQTNMYL